MKSKPDMPHSAELKKNSAGSQADSAATGAANIVWDDSAMRTAYANVCKLHGTREEISLSFGSNQSWQMARKEIRVLITDRIVLNPHTAKRLLVMLEQGMRDYESHFGKLSD